MWRRAQRRCSASQRGSHTQDRGKQRNSYKVRVGAFSAISVLFEFRWVMWSCCLSALLSLRRSLLLFSSSLHWIDKWATLWEAKVFAWNITPNNFPKQYVYVANRVDVLQNINPAYRAKCLPDKLLLFVCSWTPASVNPVVKRQQPKVHAGFQLSTFFSVNTLPFLTTRVSLRFPVTAEKFFIWVLQNHSRVLLPKRKDRVLI